MGHLSIFCIQIVASDWPRLCIRFQMRDETFQMINSTTDPCCPGSLLSLLTLAYCNLITIKLYIDQGDPGGIKTTSTHQQSTQSFIIIVFPGSDQTNRKTLTDKISGDLIFCTHFFVFSDRDFVKFLGIATQRLTVTEKSEQTRAGPSIE